MSCTPHPQVMSPCADDAVSVGQALGTRGDVNFDEYGTLNLNLGQTGAEVLFDYEKESADYRFEYLYIENADDPTAASFPIPKIRTTKSFTVDFTGAPITANSVLKWRVTVPDPLHTCAGVAGSPKYVIYAYQEGLTPFPNGADFVPISFPQEQPNADYQLEAFSVEYTGIGTPLIFAAPLIIERTTVGFTFVFQGHPDAEGYFIRWRIS